MVLQVLQLCVCFPTFVAGVRAMTLVVPLVFSEHRWVSEAFTTLSTEIWLLSGVRAHVHFELRQGGVTL